MYAIAFDLVVAQTEEHHPKGVAQAYNEIGAVLAQYGFSRVQGSLYVSQDEDMAQLFLVIESLRQCDWLPKSVRNIRAFRVEQWSDFTPLVKNTL